MSNSKSLSLSIKGLASGRIVATLPVQSSDLSLDLLSFLRKHQIPMASSCDGVGVCKKCVVQNDWLGCQMSVAEFLQRVSDGKLELAYL